MKQDPPFICVWLTVMLKTKVDTKVCGVKQQKTDAFAGIKMATFQFVLIHQHIFTFATTVLAARHPSTLVKNCQSGSTEGKT